MTTLPAVGVHCVPEHIYRPWDAVAQSTLKLLDPTPAHGKWQMDHPKPRTKEQLRGTGLHFATFEPARFESEFVEVPKVDKRTKEGKQAWAEIQEANRGKETLDTGEFDRIRGMAESIRASRAASGLINAPGQCEVAMLWQDPATGLLCKGKFDKLIDLGRPVILELKSTRDASEWGFARDCASFGYDFQAHYYRWGHEMATGRRASHVMIAVESEPPYCVAIWILSNGDMMSGANKWREKLDLYARCKATGKWPGYPDEIRTLMLPMWSQKKGDE